MKKNKITGYLASISMAIILPVVPLGGCRNNIQTKSKGYDVFGKNNSSYHVQSIAVEGGKRRIIIVDEADAGKLIQWEMSASGTLVIDGQNVVWRDGITLYCMKNGTVFKKQFPLDSSVFDTLNKDFITYEEAARAVSLAQ